MLKALQSLEPTVCPLGPKHGLGNHDMSMTIMAMGVSKPFGSSGTMQALRNNGLGVRSDGEDRASLLDQVQKHWR
jgi:hypothetical protein